MGVCVSAHIKHRHVCLESTGRTGNGSQDGKITDLVRAQKPVFFSFLIIYDLI